MRRKLQLVISSAMLALLCLSTALTGLAHAQLPTSLSSLTIDMPIWLGRSGDLVAKTPRGLVSMKGVTVSLAWPAR